MADQAEFETPKVLHDAPLRDSDEAYFHFDDFARTLARLIASRETRTPLTIGVSGPWGAGKTTLLRRICKQLDATLALTDLTRPPQLDFATQREIAEASSVSAARSGSMPGSMPTKTSCSWRSSASSSIPWRKADWAIKPGASCSTRRIRATTCWRLF